MKQLISGKSAEFIFTRYSRNIVAEAPENTKKSRWRIQSQSITVAIIQHTIYALKEFQKYLQCILNNSKIYNTSESQQDTHMEPSPQGKELYENGLKYSKK